jgi:hypothetical protein
VRVLKAADLGAVPGPEVFWMSHFGEWLPLHINVAVIQGGGHTVLVNTGPPEDYLDYMNAVWREELGDRAHITVEGPDAVGRWLDTAHVAAEDVDAVVVTPLQAYAIGNVDRFARARICVSRRGWEDLLAPPEFDPRRRMAVPDRILRYLLEDAWFERRVVLLDDEDEVLPGIRTWWAGTHHRSSLAVEVDTPAGVVSLSDVAFYYENLEQDRPLGIQESMRECRDAYRRLRSTGGTFVSLYDPRTRDRFPGGVVAGVAST